MQMEMTKQLFGFESARTVLLETWRQPSIPGFPTWEFILCQAEHCGLSCPKPRGLFRHHPAALVLTFWYFNIQSVVIEPLLQSDLVSQSETCSRAAWKRDTNGNNSGRNQGRLPSKWGGSHSPSQGPAAKITRLPFPSPLPPCAHPPGLQMALDETEDRCSK